MKRSSTILLLLVAVLQTACKQNADVPTRPVDPWFFRSVLDKRPRMLTIALDTSCYLAYDLQRCTLYKTWYGGVTMEGAAYSDVKNVQPTSWGNVYLSDSVEQFQWHVSRDGKKEFTTAISRGYYIKDNGIHLKWGIVLSAGDTLIVEEYPEISNGNDGRKTLSRRFTSTGENHDNVSLAFESRNTEHQVHAGKPVTIELSLRPGAKPQPPAKEASYDHRGRHWMEKSDCLTCHEVDKSTVGPSFIQIAQKYPKEKTAIQYLIRKVKDGGSGVWGNSPMNAHPSLSERELREMINYILSLRKEDDVPYNLVSGKAKVPEEFQRRPGHGAPLDGLHPGLTLETIRKKDFRPRVGGLAFHPDGRLLVTTWDVIGGVYALTGVESGDTSKISVERIASGLAEPLGICVVNGDIYVLQKHELTKLSDLDRDGTIDHYEPVCNSWGVTGDFHEFAFGLVHKDGYFYATLSMAMRLMATERQHPDRGHSIRIGMDGRYERVISGLRTPNGIGIGVDGELFVADNQGEWTPANKLIHVREGDFHGMPWALQENASTPAASRPAIWLPQNEIGNSPSEPVLISGGPYAGQMLHGDVTHGGIKRDFIEKVEGQYQGAVFRFTQGLEAGINRMVWGPDGALYVGGVGMVGGWSWKEKQFGLQKLVFNGNTAFEMLAVRVRNDGFTIELTEPLEDGRELDATDIVVQQWRYVATENYGGPKVDLTTLPIHAMKVSDDRRTIRLTIAGLKEGHVVYLRLPEDLKSKRGQSIWSTEAWYTLNRIPKGDETELNQ